MKPNTLIAITLLMAVFVLLHYTAESKKVVIHIPYRVKNVKHVHTVYKIIPQHHEAKNDYKGDADGEDERYEFYRRR